MWPSTYQVIDSISGASAFGFNRQELEKALHLILPVISTIGLDGAYGMVKPAHRRLFKRDAPWFHIANHRWLTASTLHGKTHQSAHQ
jgi:thiamine pyrophosphate-dependent acetolactate synthase large subunit-like protein